MVETIDNRVFVELREILKYTEKSIVNKIPQKILDKLNLVDSEGYEFKYDFSKELKEQAIQPKTKELLSGLYLKYCCDEERRDQLIEKCKQNDEIYAESVEVKWHKPKSKVSENTTELTVVKEGFFSKLISKIKRIFGK